MKLRKKKSSWLSCVELPIGGVIGLFLVLFFVIGEMARGNLHAGTGYLFLGGLFVANVVLVTWFILVLAYEPADGGSSQISSVFSDLPSTETRRQLNVL
jgi:hypothetical protein